MKLVLFLMLLVGSTSFACPNLSGNYKFNSDNNTVNVTVSQKESNSVVTYTFNFDNSGDINYVSNGQPQGATNIADDGTITSYSKKASCTQDILIIENEFKEMTSTGEILGFGFGIDTYKKDSNENIMVHHKHIYAIDNEATSLEFLWERQ